MEEKYRDERGGYGSFAKLATIASLALLYFSNMNMTTLILKDS